MAVNCASLRYSVCLETEISHSLENFGVQSDGNFQSRQHRVEAGVWIVVRGGGPYWSGGDFAAVPGHCAVNDFQTPSAFNVSKDSLR